MRSLGLDVGDRRTGVAISDPEGILATPLTVLDSPDEDALIDAVLRLVGQHRVERIVVGLPRHMDGRLGRQANKVTAFVDRLRLRASETSPEGHLSAFDIQLWDERLSTQTAERLKTEARSKGQKLRSAAKRGARHHSFRARAGLDAMAAALILQGYLDSLKDGEEWPDI
ncbi:MAG: Holliday junction resolvase RuvX [Dehalococcoidia bacterium]